MNKNWYKVAQRRIKPKQPEIDKQWNTLYQNGIGPGTIKDESELRAAIRKLYKAQRAVHPDVTGKNDDTESVAINNAASFLKSHWNDPDARPTGYQPGKPWSPTTAGPRTAPRPNPSTPPPGQTPPPKPNQTPPPGPTPRPGAGPTPKPRSRPTPPPGPTPPPPGNNPGTPPPGTGTPPPGPTPPPGGGQGTPPPGPGPTPPPGAGPKRKSRTPRPRARPGDPFMDYVQKNWSGDAQKDKAMVSSLIGRMKQMANTLK